MKVRVIDMNGEIVFEDDLYKFLTVMLAAAGYIVDRVEMRPRNGREWLPVTAESNGNANPQAY